MEEIREVRQEKTKTIFEELKAWAKEMSNKVPPKSLIGKAIAYFIGQLPKLGYFIDNPIVGPDTNVVENATRPFAVGRKNWLFSDTARGADASANLFSLVITARANGIEPYNYLKEVFSQLPKAVSIEDICCRSAFLRVNQKLRWIAERLLKFLYQSQFKKTEVR